MGILIRTQLPYAKLLSLVIDISVSICNVSTIILMTLKIKIQMCLPLNDLKESFVTNNRDFAYFLLCYVCVTSNVCFVLFYLFV